MSTEYGIYEYMLTLSDLVELVGDRIFPGPLPQEEDIPAVTYQKINALPWASQSGSSGTGQARYQIDIWAQTHEEIVVIEGALQAGFHGYKGIMGDRTIQACFVINSLDTPDLVADRRRRIMDIRITDSLAL